MNKGKIENPLREKEAPKMGKKKQPRLPETGEGNKPVEIWGPKNGRVELRVLGKHMTLGYTVENGKFRGHIITETTDSQVYDPVSHELPGNLEEKALKQGFARLQKDAEDRHLIIQERKKWKEHKGRQPDLL